MHFGEDDHPYDGPDRRASARRDSGRRRTDYRRIDLARMLGTAFFCTFIIMGFLAFGIVNTNDRAAENGKRTSDLGACVLHELSVHRKATQDYQQAVAQQRGLQIPPAEPVPQFPDLEHTCAQFTQDGHSTTTTTR